MWCMRNRKTRFGLSNKLKSSGIIVIVLSSFVLFTFNRCGKSLTIIPIPPTETDVHFLGHKGGGNNAYNPYHIENSLPAVQDGLKTMNGVEVDIQMSLDGTIWIYHNADLGETCCDTSYHRSLPLLKDSEIEKVLICSGTKQSRIYKLQELIDFWNNYPNGFVISMHVKTDQGSSVFNNPIIGGQAAYLSKMADNLLKVFTAVNYDNQLHFEVFSGAFLNKIHTNIPKAKVILLKEVDFPSQIDAALSGGYDGVSCHFSDPTVTAAEVKRARDKGLIVHTWTPDTVDELKKALALHPNFIQTDDINAISNLNLKIL